MDVIQQIAQELNVKIKQVADAVNLLDGGATVPFIARYRKEATGGLDDTQLRILEERLIYLRELNERRTTILESISTQGKLTPALEKSIKDAETKTLLEDLYLPYKPRRRTKAQIAREAGLEPLAEQILNNRDCNPDEIAKAYIYAEKDIPDADAALSGARHIIMENISEIAGLLTDLREHIWQNGILQATVVKDKELEGEKFSDYFDYQEAIKKIPSHRALALFRGRNENFINLTLLPGKDIESAHQQCIQNVARYMGIQNSALPAEAWLLETARLTWKIKLFTRIDLDLKLRLRESAELEAISVFGKNLRDLLLAAPAGPRTTMGLDPGLRTGVKVAVVDPTGKLLDSATIYPHVPQRKWDESIASLAALIQRHKIDLVSIGNGTGSRETDQLVADLIKRHPELPTTRIIVSEAGASVYSASELASSEFPDLDVSLRGAVSIARRLQDPLAELVKIEAKAIGVGQYQHDVNQVKLTRGLNGIVEDCVNAVGVDVNTASVPLLKQVSGLTDSVSQNIIDFRDANGPYQNRTQLKNVPRLGEKAYQQAAGFLRIMNGKNPLDASAVHPEAYPVVQRILDSTSKSINDLVGHSDFLRKLDAAHFTDENFGLPTVADILHELEKPGRDPRPEFKTATFKDGIEKLSDLTPGISLEGVVTNVANFGAFVDIGVHQDGLVHISQLADAFVKDPRDVVKTGQLVKVVVLEVDVQRKRISLTMKKNSTNSSVQQPTRQIQKKKHENKPSVKTQGSMAEAFARALNK